MKNLFYQIEFPPCFKLIRFLVPEVFVAMELPQTVSVLHKVRVVVFQLIELVSSGSVQDWFQQVVRNTSSVLES